MDFVKKPYHQICGSEEVTKVKYRKHTCPKGTYYVGDCDEASDFIYLSNSDKKGFGGRDITFEMIDGTTETQKGPWKVGSADLFKDTGVDVRGQVSSFVLIAKSRASEPHPTWPGSKVEGYNGILYKDIKPMRLVDRGVSPQSLAKMFANQLGHTVYLYHDSKSGSSCGPVDPDGLRHTSAPKYEIEMRGDGWFRVLKSDGNASAWAHYTSTVYFDGLVGCTGYYMAKEGVYSPDEFLRGWAVTA